MSQCDIYAASSPKSEESFTFQFPVSISHAFSGGHKDANVHSPTRN